MGNVLQYPMVRKKGQIDHYIYNGIAWCKLAISLQIQSHCKSVKVQYICMCMYFNDQKKVLLKLTQYYILKQVLEVFLSIAHCTVFSFLYCYWFMTGTNYEPTKRQIQNAYYWGS